MAETITLSTKVEYKKRRKPRAFKVWDSQLLTQAMINAAEISRKIEEAKDEQNLSVSELKPTIINTELLYVLSENYLQMYRKLLSENLLKTGNIRSNPNIH